MDDYNQTNELTDRDAVYTDQNNILRNKWHQTRDIRSLSENTNLYNVSLNFNSRPLSNIENSYIWTKTNSHPDSKLWDTEKRVNVKTLIIFFIILWYFKINFFCRLM